MPVNGSRFLSRWARISESDYPSQMPTVICVDLLNLACCAIEAARGFELWRSQVSESDSLMVVTPGELGADDGSASAPDLSILVVAGTVSKAQGDLVIQRYEALPEPRAVVAFGVCTISGGPYWDSYSVLPGIEALVEVDAMVPGCPPLPEDVAAVLDKVIAAKLGLATGADGLATASQSAKAEAHA